MSSRKLGRDRSPNLPRVGLTGFRPGCSSWPILQIFFVTVSCATATTHYVDLNSTNPVSPFISWQTAATNIQDALNITGNGETVLVNDGTYNLSPGIKVNRGTLKSVNGPSSTILKGNGTGRVVELVSDGSITLDGFTVTGGSEDKEEYAAGGGILAYHASAKITISNCIVEHNRSRRWGGGIGVKGKSGVPVSVIISNCIVRHNEADLSCGGVVVASLMWNPGIVTMENCLVYENEAGSVGGGVGAIDRAEEPSDKFKVVNCTIWGNEVMGGNGISWGGGVVRCCLYNSIVYHNYADDRSDIGDCKEVVNTCASDAPGGSGNISADPKFVKPRKGVFHLKENSPCIDAGDNRYATQTADLAGNPRMMDADWDGEARVDMGAYEYVILSVEIDIRPGLNSNLIDRKARGFLPVAILTTDAFQVSEVDPASIRFAEATPYRRMMQDVDQDGDVDLLLLFNPSALKLEPTSTQVLLTGRTKEKQPFMGKSPIVLSSD